MIVTLIPSITERIKRKSSVLYPLNSDAFVLSHSAASRRLLNRRRQFLGRFTDLMRKLKEVREFSIDERWISNVVSRRKVHILNERKRLNGELDDARPPDKGERPPPRTLPLASRLSALTEFLPQASPAGAGPRSRRRRPRWTRAPSARPTATTTTASSSRAPAAAPSAAPSWTP